MSSLSDQHATTLLRWNLTAMQAAIELIKSGRAAQGVKLLEVGLAQGKNALKEPLDDDEPAEKDC